LSDNAKYFICRRCSGEVNQTCSIRLDHSQPAAALEFFATSPKLRGAVGLDENGNLVRALDDGRFESLEQIGADEIAARQAALASARASSRIENIAEHPVNAAIADCYALGELTIEEAIAAVTARDR